MASLGNETPRDPKYRRRILDIYNEALHSGQDTRDRWEVMYGGVRYVFPVRKREHVRDLREYFRGLGKVPIAL